MAHRRQTDAQSIGPGRRRLAAVLVVCQVAATLGFAVPVRGGVAKDGSRPFPCQSRPCGCLTYEACWAGDCCCFTLREKVAWADARGLAPPAHAVRATCASAGDDGHACCRPAKDCCVRPTAAPPAPPDDGFTFRWVVGLTAAQCKGSSLAAWLAASPALPPAAPEAWAFTWVPAGIVPAFEPARVCVPSTPADPPPRG